MRKRGLTLMRCGTLLLSAALLLTGYNLWDDHRAGQTAGAALDGLRAETVQEAASSEETDEIISDALFDPDMEMPVLLLDGQAYIGVLRIASLGLELPVISEWSETALRLAPCRYAGTAYRDGFILAGHNYRTHFSGLKRLSVGAAVEFTDVSGNCFRYTVAGFETVKADDLAGMYAGNWPLTLFTCTTGGQSRLAVRCEKEKAYT